MHSILMLVCLPRQIIILSKENRLVWLVMIRRLGNIDGGSFLIFTLFSIIAKFIYLSAKTLNFAILFTHFSEICFRTHAHACQLAGVHTFYLLLLRPAFHTNQMGISCLAEMCCFVVIYRAAIIQTDFVSIITQAKRHHKICKRNQFEFLSDFDV